MLVYVCVCLYIQMAIIIVVTAWVLIASYMLYALGYSYRGSLHAIHHLPNAS